MINIIAAMAKNRVIGWDGKIPWNIPEDKSYFKKITSGSIVIMGRRTFEEIGFPLPNRYNIVVSGQKSFSGDSLCTAVSTGNALEIARNYAEKHGISEIFLCGGEKIYTHGLQYAQRIYLTELDDEYKGDTFFPVFSMDKFRLSEYKYVHEAKLSFCVYERR